MRQIRRHRIITGAALGALPLLLSTGCSFDFSFGGPGAVAADEVAERSSEMLAEQIGQAPDDLTCAEDLPAEVGAEIRCELTEGGESLGVTITTTSVDGSDVQWDVQVDDAPADGAAADDTSEDDTGAMASGGAVPADQVAQQSSAQLETLVGHAPEDFTCSENLPAEVGAEIRCNLVDGGMNYGVTITTTSVDGSDVQWDILVDEEPL
ncbi:DUF4333 domain-containing protein [Nocardiopsis sp. CT-R113]|uniref:DUF4333 domain-containing protein n=1 Tax=Nocardiopsis codii TaxID=3065942 RepID=A0ABU7K6R6_9ACTN|nr:DUF4333 domain-containing protein [Nocardiopsis sp. CT-R113]MEE2037717.1 DUF4333 domain-containing protein [Nocardiopsis sp. CT-R113]